MDAIRQGFTVWLTGLSGAGKSTLARSLGAALRARGHAVEVLDGDEVREHLSKDLGFSKADRDTHIYRVGFVAEMLSRHGIAVISATISPYRDVRNDVRRTHNAPFVEVFLDCPLEELVRRDPKGLYAKALEGNVTHFTGVSDPYEPPVAPEVHLHTDRESIDESLRHVLQALERSHLTSSDRVMAADHKEE